MEVDYEQFSTFFPEGAVIFLVLFLNVPFWDRLKFKEDADYS